MLTLFEKELKVRNAPVTYKGNRYAPVQNSLIMDIIEEQCDRSNLIIDSKAFRTARNAQRVIADYTIKTDLDNEIGFMLSFGNSTDGSMAAVITSGAKTYICSNGSYYGDSFRFKRKHINSVSDITDAVYQSINLLERDLLFQIDRKNNMKLIELSKREMSELAGRLFIEEKILSPTQIARLKDEIEKPSFDYQSDNSLWEMYSHVTHVLKTSEPISYLPRYTKAGTFFQKEIEKVI